VGRVAIRDVSGYGGNQRTVGRGQSHWTVERVAIRGQWVEWKSDITRGQLAIRDGQRIRWRSESLLGMVAIEEAGR